MNRAGPATLAALLAIGLLTGCGGGEGTAPSPATQTATTTEPGGATGVGLEKLGDFDSPLYVAQPPGESSNLFVVEQGGKIRVVHDGKAQSRPFLDLTDEVTSGYEQGLLSVAFAPDYPESGRFYVDYTDLQGDTLIVEFRRSGDSPLHADAGSRRELLKIEDRYPNHNGGLLLFGPDKKLYVGTGDGGSPNDAERNGQSLGTLLGKILRIEPRPGGGPPYSVPDDNPFVDRAGARPEIYAYGLRNPWRFSFDRDTKAVSIGDVGQNEFEEVDYLDFDGLSGANFGWSAFEGGKRFNTDQDAPEAVAPILTYGTSDRGCAVTGGYVVRDPELPSLEGRYVYGDHCGGELFSFEPSTTRAKDERPLGLEVPNLSSFGEDNAGHVYATSLDGPVYRLTPR